MRVVQEFHLDSKTTEKTLTFIHTHVGVKVARGIWLCNAVRNSLRGSILVHLGKGRWGSTSTSIHIQVADPLDIFCLNRHHQIDMKTVRGFYTIHRI